MKLKPLEAMHFDSFTFTTKPSRTAISVKECKKTQPGIKQHERWGEKNEQKMLSVPHLGPPSMVNVQGTPFYKLIMAHPLSPKLF